MGTGTPACEPASKPLAVSQGFEAACADVAHAA